MKALIFEQPGSIGAGALDVAGRMLLIRQLQWLRDRGITDVVVEITIGSAADARASALLGEDPLTHGCLVIPSRSPLGDVALAQRAGLARDELYLALPADLLVHGPLSLPDAPRTLRLAPPGFAVQSASRPLQFRSRVRAEEAAEAHEDPGSWSVVVADPGAAHALSCAALGGRAPDLLVHAAELRPGVWISRGARVAEDAKLLPPVLVGPQARVFARAQLGPNVVIGARAVIERDALLAECSVAAETLVGEAVRVRHAQVEARGITSFADQAHTSVKDSLQLTDAIDRSAPPLARMLALVLLALLGVPWVVAFSATAIRARRVVRSVPFRGQSLHAGSIGVELLDLVPSLYDVAIGRRDLLGVADLRALEVEGGRGDGPARAGAIDLSPALAPGASTSTVLWMWRWYLRNKTGKLDRQLLGIAARRWLTFRAQSAQSASR